MRRLRSNALAITILICRMFAINAKKVFITPYLGTSAWVILAIPARFASNWVLLRNGNTLAVVRYMITLVTSKSVAIPFLSTVAWSAHTKVTWFCVRVVLILNMRATISWVCVLGCTYARSSFAMNARSISIINGHDGGGLVSVLFKSRVFV
jgi:hypothetical protein